MRKATRTLVKQILPAIVVSLFQISLFAANVVVTVNVKDGATPSVAIPGVKIYAISYGPKGPDGAASLVGGSLTDGTGNVDLTLDDSKQYEIIADKQLVGPTARTQFFSPSHLHLNTGFTAGTRNITLNQTFTGRATVTVHVTNATGLRFISGGLRKKSTGSDVAFGGCVAGAGGDCDVVFNNVPPLLIANGYEFGIFDPSGLNGNGVGNGAQIPTIVTSTDNIEVNLDISQGLPPDLTAGSADNNNGNQNQQSLAGATVRGVVEDFTDASLIVPWTNINLMVRDAGSGNLNDVRGSGVNEQGRFEFVNLSSGIYYVRTGPSCNNQTGFCYEGAASTTAFIGGIGLNDIEITAANFTNNEVVFKHVRVNQVPSGTAQIRVKVKKKDPYEALASTAPLIPNSHVNMGSDWSRWWNETHGAVVDCNDPSGAFNNPGLTMKNVEARSGNVVLSSVTPGNYTLSVWTPYNNSNNNQGNMLNAGLDGEFTWGGGDIRGCDDNSPNDEDDLRLYVGADDSITVFDINGATVDAMVDNTALDGIPVINIGVVPPIQNFTNHLHGTLIFPEVANLTLDPITLSLNEQDCGNDGCQSNFVTIGGEGVTPDDTYTYDLAVASGAYWLDITSGYWGKVGHGGNNQIVFSETVTDITKDFKFARAGRVSGTLYKPDGSVFKTGSTGGNNGWVSAGIDVRCGNDGGGPHGQVNEDGTFLIGGILPAECDLLPQLWGGSSSFNYAPKSPPDRVVVKANEDVEKNVKFVNGVLVAANVTNKADLPAIAENYNSSGWNDGEAYTIQMVPSGTPMDAPTITKILVNDDERNAFFYAPAAQSSPCGGGWPGGYCGQRVPTGVAKDFMLLRRGNIDGGTHQYMTILGRIDNVAISEENLGANVYYQGSTVPAVHVDFAPQDLTQGTKISGTVIAANIIRKVDFDSFGGSFDNFIKYIPLMTAKDANGNLLGAGLITPPPEVLEGEAGQEVEDLVAQGDWEGFKALMGVEVWSYEFRAMPTNTDVFIFGTTPNYPPVFKKVHTGAVGETTTWNINWDKLVGTGGTISGTVADANGDPIENAAVAIKTPGTSKTATTDSSGNYKFEGLPAGPFKITVTAPTFAPQAKKTVISGEETDVVDFVLIAGPGSISGLVEEMSSNSSGIVRRPVEGASLLAYDDTSNAANPGVPLALIKTQTDSLGEYKLDGMISGHEYVVMMKADGRYPKRTTVTATGGEVTGVDFLLEQKPLQVDVVIKHNDAENKFIFKILNPQNFESGQVWYYDSANTFNSGTDPDITNDFDNLPDGSLVAELLDSALTSGITYKLHIVATPADGSQDVTVEVPFGLELRDSAIRNIDEEILGDSTEGEDGIPENRVVGGDGTTSIDIDPGTLLPDSDSALPTAEIAGTTPADDGETDIVGDAIEITFNNVQFTDNPLPFAMPFDATNVEDISSLGLYQYDETTGVWTLVTNQISVDPVQGSASGFISAGSAISAQANLPGSSAVHMQAKGGKPTMSALKTSKGYKTNPHAAASGSAIFAVGLVQSSGTAVADGQFHQYNFPNPFNLVQKSVTRRDGVDSIRGTLIVVAPTGTGSPDITIRIYNVAGDMVREIKQPSTAGQYNYYEWDGKNTSGDDVASGVYFAHVDAPGAPKREPIKMVLVK